MSILERILQEREQPASAGDAPGELVVLEELQEFEREMNERYGVPLGTGRRLSRGKKRLSFDVWWAAFRAWLLLRKQMADPAVFKDDRGVRAPELPDRFVQAMLREFETIAKSVDAVSTATLHKESPIVQTVPDLELESLRSRANAARAALGRVRLLVLSGDQARDSRGTSSKQALLASAASIHAEIAAMGGEGYGRAVAAVCRLWADALGINGVTESTIRRHLR